MRCIDPTVELGRDALEYNNDNMHGMLVTPDFVPWRASLRESALYFRCENT